MIVGNDGPLLRSTSYWGLPAAKAGFLYGSWNAGSLRVLVPRSIEGWLAEMRTGKEALLSVGREANRDVLVVIFDDGSEEPYSIAIDMAQTDWRAPPSDRAPGRTVRVLVYTEAGLQLDLPGRWE